jgi:hypothetical protein
VVVGCGRKKQAFFSTHVSRLHLVSASSRHGGSPGHSTWKQYRRTCSGKADTFCAWSDVSSDHALLAHIEEVRWDVKGLYMFVQSGADRIGMRGLEMRPLVRWRAVLP